MDRDCQIREPVPKNILILRALQFGDLMCSVPAFRALRKALPEAKITLTGLPWSRDFVHRFSQYLDDFVEFPGFPGFPEIQPRIQEFSSFLLLVQSLNFDLSIQMQGSGNLSNSLTVLFGAKNNAGFYLPGQYCPDPTRFLAYPVYEPEVMRHLLLMDFLGIPMRGTQLEFPIDQLEWQEEQSLRADHGLVPGEYICIHPGSRAPERRWAPSNFAQLADDLSEQGFTVALTGSAEEEPITQEVIELMRSRPVNLTGKTSIGVLGALLTHSRLLISNDTGVSHLADALNIPSIILFLSSEPRRWAPLNRSLHKVISWADAVPPQGILLEVEELLKEERSYAA